MGGDAIHTFYVLYSKQCNRFYYGVTVNLAWRLEQHDRGMSPYTRKRGPWILVHIEEYPSKDEALSREKEVKGWKSKKLVIERFHIDLEALLNRQSGSGEFAETPG